MENSTKQTNPFEDMEVIYAYTRAQALADGVLVDVSKLASEAGFKYPVAITQALWETIEKIPFKFKHEDTTGRLWDVLWMASYAVKHSKSGTDLHYTVTLNTIDDRRINQRKRLRLNCGPGDKMEPVITIGFPEDF
jgi:hypothetical protein